MRVIKRGEVSYIEAEDTLLITDWHVEDVASGAEFVDYVVALALFQGIVSLEWVAKKRGLDGPLSLRSPAG